jgi:hypothetical protein
MTTTHWRDRAPANLLHTEGPDGEPCNTTTDRRWLWRLEKFLAVYGTDDIQRQMGSDLRQYLNETCDHHWTTYQGGGGIPAHRQCAWCSDVEWFDGYGGQAAA